MNDERDAKEEDAPNRGDGRAMSGRNSTLTRWTPDELRELEPYALGLVHGKYRFAKEAVAAYQARPDPSRALESVTSHAVAPRSAGAIKFVLLHRARALGRSPRAVAWTQEEAQRLDWYAAQVVNGRIASVAQAARDFLAEREELCRRRPDASGLSVRRTQSSAHSAIWERAQRQGRPLLAPRWSLPEQRVCQRYARLLLQDKFRNASHAAQSAVSDIAQLHRDHPDERWTNARRTFTVVRIQIRRWAGTAHRRWSRATFSSEEDRVLNRYAQDLVKKRFPDVGRATQACWEELERRHRRSQQKLSPALRTPQPRSPSNVRRQVAKRSLALGRAKTRAIWAPAELEVALKWSREFLETRERHGRLLEIEAGRMMSEELNRNGFDRNSRVCTGRLHNIVHGWRPGEKPERGQPFVSSRDLAPGTYPIKRGQ